MAMRTRAALAAVAAHAVVASCIVAQALAAASRPAPAAQPGTFVIEVQQVGRGSVVPDGFVSVPAGADQAFEFIPDDCYRVADVMVDDVSLGSIAHYTFTNVQSDHMIYISFAPVSYAIVALSSPGGTMVPSGTVSVTCGADVRFDTQAEGCARLTDLQVDGVSLGRVTSYTFTNVRADHTIYAAFAAVQTTTTTLSVTPVVGSCATPDTLVAHVSDAHSGSVGFFDGDVSLGGVGLGTDGVAMLIVSPPLAVGIHELTARYAGDACTPPSASETVSYPVPLDPGTPSVHVELSVTPNPVRVGERDSLTATVSAPGVAASLLTGHVSFFDGSTLIAGAVVTDGTAEASILAVAAGQHAITAEYDGDGCFAPARSDVVNLEVLRGQSQLRVGGTRNPSTQAEIITATANVLLNGVVATMASGSIEFRLDGAPLGTAPVSSGLASISLGALAPGNHAIEALYSGDSSVTPSTASYAQTVVPCGGQATVALSVSKNPAQRTDAIDLWAYVSVNGVPPSLIDGVVDFYDGAMLLGTLASPAGGARFLGLRFATGTHTLTAQYRGNGCFGPALSNVVDLRVYIRLTVLDVIGTPDPSIIGAPVTITAHLQADSAVAAATGTVQFVQNAAVLGTAVMTGAQASFSIDSLAVGDHWIEARYSGDAVFGPSAAAYTQRVWPIPTQMRLVVSSSSLNPGDSLSLMAAIDPPQATGTVNIYESGRLVGGVPVQGGTATIRFQAVTAGFHQYWAIYAGDATYGPSSAYVEVVVGPVTLTLTSAPNPAGVGSLIQFTATLSPRELRGTVNFTIDGVNYASGLYEGVAYVSLNTLQPGVHTAVAHYSRSGGPIVDSNELTQTVLETRQFALRVLYPNGGERVLVGSTLEIRWDPAPNTHLPTASIFISRHQPPDWELIANVPNTGSYSWMVTGPGTNRGPTEVRSALIAVMDLSGRVGSDASDAPFSIMDLATPTVVTRLDAEPCDLGIRVTWSLTNPGRFARFALERAPAEVGSWLGLATEVREQSGVSVAEDRTVVPGQTYWYRVVGTTAGGSESVFGPVKATARAPAELALSAARPNPTRGAFTVQMALPRATPVRLRLLDGQGRVVAVLASGEYAAGRYQVDWDGRSERGPLPSGVYFVELTAPQRLVRRIAIVH